MKITKTTLSSEDLLNYALKLKSVIRALVQNDSRLTYQQSLHAIGLKAETSKWEISHREHYSAISGLLAAVEAAAGEKESEFNRIFNAQKGESGNGVHKHTRLFRFDTQAELDAFKPIK